MSATTTTTLCPEVHTGGLTCSLLAGHTGEHTAHGLDGVVLTTWGGDGVTATTAVAGGPYVDDNGELIQSAIDADKLVITRGKRGVDGWVMYFELLNTKKAPAEVTRFMVFRDRVCRQVKTVGSRNARWTTKMGVPDITAIDASLLRGEPITVQLLDSDIKSLNEGDVPLVRYTCKQEYETLYGKVEGED